MPKMKTHKGTAKRLKRTATKKLTREGAFGAHKLMGKSKSRKRAIKITKVVKGSLAKNAKRVGV